MDLCGPMRVQSINGKRYILVIVDDYSRLTWVLFLAHKDEAFEKFSNLCKRIQNQQGLKISTVQSDHGREFENKLFEEFCNDNGITHNFSAPRTPQQNGVVERQNRTVQQMARSMMKDKKISQGFWVEAIHTAIHILNKVHLMPNSDKTPHELWFGRPAIVKHFKVFGSKCYIKNNDENIGKYDDRADEGIFLGYATNSKGYRCYNKRLHKLVDCIDIKFDEEIPVRNVSSAEPRT